MNKVTPIDSEMLARFEQGYEARPALQVMSNAISRTALPDAAFVPAAAAKLQMDFSVLVKTNNITNQKQSGRCWMFSTLNVLRQRVIEKCKLEDFSISPTYLAFYDKLEKANLFFENIIHFAGQELDDRETFTLMGNPLPDGGQWDMAISLIKKYGVVPSWVMPETVHSTGTAKYLPILTRKMREDALELRALVRAGKDPAARREEMLAEIYNALRILYGQPPKTFDFEYTDTDKVYHCDRGLTPKNFLEKYVGNDFDDYVVIISSPIHEIDRTYCQPFMGDVVEDNMFWLNLSQEELEDLTIRQLQAGEGVMFSCDCHPDGDRANGYWDPDFPYDQGRAAAHPRQHHEPLHDVLRRQSGGEWHREPLEDREQLGRRLRPEGLLHRQREVVQGQRLSGHGSQESAERCPARPAGSGASAHEAVGPAGINLRMKKCSAISAWQSIFCVLNLPAGAAPR